MKRKLFLSLLISGISLMVFPCFTYAEEEGTDMEVEVWIEAYQESGACLSVTEVFGEEEPMVNETGGLTCCAQPGVKIGEMLESVGMIEIEPIKEDDVFEGWMEYEMIVAEDEDGFQMIEEYVRRSEGILYTTEEMLELEVPEYYVMYVAKWESIPEEDYFQETDDSMMAVEESCVLTLDANEGEMVFAAEEPYTSDLYTYYLEEGKSVQELIESSEFEDPLDSVEKEGAEFKGWTVYEGDSVIWSSEVSEEENALSVELWEDTYMILTNSRACMENISTEELMEIVCTDTSFYAVAAWE